MAASGAEVSCGLLEYQLERQPMESIGTVSDATDKVLKDLQRCLATVCRLASGTFETPEAGIAVLRKLRRETYEDINQIQHEHSILLAAQWLIENGKCSPTTEWSWNPRQTGTATEPDLQGHDKGSIVVSAEITTSERPVGVIDTRMGKTLGKLSGMVGERYYFVCGERMRNRAQTKVAKAGWPITVVLLLETPQAS
jgi:hypothetical protein